MVLGRAILLVGLVGCTSPLTSVDDSGLGVDSGGSDTGVTDDIASWDPYDGLVHDTACNDVSGSPVAGATGFFVGDFDVNGSNLQGVEEWVLFANPTWTQAGGPATSCFLRWNVVGTLGEPDSCVGCTHELTATGSFDADASNCPTALEEIEGVELDLKYFIQRRSSGEATWTFESGTTLGDGVVTSDRAAYVTDSACNWF